MKEASNPPSTGGRARFDAASSSVAARLFAQILACAPLVCTSCLLVFDPEPYVDASRRDAGMDAVADAGFRDGRVLDAPADVGIDAESLPPCTVTLRDARLEIARPASGPAPGASQSLTTLGTCIRRVSTSSLQGPTSPSSAPTNLDRSRMIVFDNGAYYNRVLDLATGAESASIGSLGAEPIWDAASSARLFRFNGESAHAIAIVSVAVGVDEESAFDLDADLAAIFPAITRVGAGDDGHWLSADRTKAAFFVRESGGTAGIATYTQSAGDFERVATRPGTADVAWLRITPSGRFVVVCWADGAMRAYPFDLGAEHEIAPGDDQCAASPHPNAALRLRNGHDAFVYATPFAIRAVDLDLLAGDPTLARYPLETSFGHEPGTLHDFLLAAPVERDGWLIVHFESCEDPSTSEDCAPGLGWAQDKIVALEVPNPGTATPPRVLALAWDYSLRRELLAVEPDLGHVYFSSDWGESGQEAIYELALGASIPP